MDQELLRCLLSAFPPDDELVILGYRLPYGAASNESLLGLLADRRRNGAADETARGMDRG